MKKKILIIEDETPIISVLSKSLSNDFDVISSLTGMAGLDEALKTHPDLILLDIILPRITGIEMLQKLREDEWGKTAKVVVITNLTDSPTEEAVTKLGALEFVVKSSASLAQIAEKVRKYVA